MLTLSADLVHQWSPCCCFVGHISDKALFQLNQSLRECRLGIIHYCDESILQVIGGKLHFVVGGFTLLIGLVLYFLFRPSHSAAIFSWLSIDGPYWVVSNTIVRNILGSAPTFLHVFAFSCLTCAMVDKPSLGDVAWISASWSVVNMLAELGQLARSYDFCVDVVLMPYSYFCRGVFDPIDLLLAAIGGFVSFRFLTKTRGG